MNTSLTPYEGSQEYIFVSYSHQDREKVLVILKKLDQAGFRVWYDEGIEWGSEWPASIAMHLNRCAVLMAFHSRNSVSSTNCRQEINYALKYHKSIISVYLEEVELEPGVDMQLTLFQSTYPYQYADQQEFFSRLIETRLLQCCRETGGIKHSAGEEAPSRGKQDDGAELNRKKGSLNFDQEMSDKFSELFSSSEKREDRTKTALEEKVSQIKSRQFAAALENEIQKNAAATDEVITPNISLVPLEYVNDECPNNILQGKHFSFPNLPGIKTIIFQVYRGVDYTTLTKFYYPEPLPFTEHKGEDGKVTETVYYIDEPQSCGNQLILLHFNQKNEVFINNGLLYGDEVRISKKPVLFSMQTLYSDDIRNGTAIPVGSAAYAPIPDAYFEDRSGTPDAEDEIICEADISETPVITIDPETSRPVLREVFFDETSNTWKARIKIQPHKKYFTFQLRGHNDEERIPLTELEIASYYREGKYMFPQDVFQAISHYEKDGSADAYYEIATLFRTDSSLLDEDTYLEYLLKASEVGSAGARVELALRYSLTDDIHDLGASKELLDKAIGDGSSIAGFVRGYLIEAGFFAEDRKKAFEFYYNAANDLYAPALTRLCCKQNNLTNIDTIFKHFMSAQQDGLAIAKYCMGCILFFGIDISADKPRGMLYLAEAARMGNKMAAEALHTIHSIDPEFKLGSDE